MEPHQRPHVPGQDQLTPHERFRLRTPGLRYRRYVEVDRFAPLGAPGHLVIKARAKGVSPYRLGEITATIVQEQLQLQPGTTYDEYKAVWDELVEIALAREMIERGVE